DGQPVGEIAQENVFGKIRFGFSAGGQPVGAIQAENWRGWDFAILGHTRAGGAPVTKTSGGLAQALLTPADHYVLQIPRPLPAPLLSLVVASALSVDTALKQDSRGLG